jgi:DNA-binding transcriptional MerR regulator
MPYNLSEIAKEFGLTARALRFYESKGLVTPARNGLARIYSDADRVTVSRIVKLTAMQFTIAEVREILDYGMVTDDKRSEQLAVMRKRHAEAQLAIVMLERLDAPIAGDIDKIEWLRLWKETPALASPMAKG